MEMVFQTANAMFSATLRGNFTFGDNPEFRIVLEKLADPDIKQVVLNMRQVGFVDSAALGMLLLAHDEAEKHKKPLLLEGVNGQVKHIFEMARFDRFFKF